MKPRTWPGTISLIALGAGWLILIDARECQAQVLRSSLPIHLDDRESPTSALPTQWVNQAVSLAGGLETSQTVPPPLPVPPTDREAPQPLQPDSNQSALKADPKPSGTGTTPSPKSQTTARKSYIPEQKPISQISIDVSSKAKAGSSQRPEDMFGTAAEELPAISAATADQMHLGWMATPQRTSEQFPYQPLYFEEVNLERYGRSAGVWQPALSTTRFFATVPLLPYKMTAHSPHKPYYWSWPYEAGASAPQVRETFPIQRPAALVEASVLTGAAFLIP